MLPNGKLYELYLHNFCHTWTDVSKYVLYYMRRKDLRLQRRKPTQNWYYYPFMEKEECLLFKVTFSIPCINLKHCEEKSRLVKDIDMVFKVIKFQIWTRLNNHPFMFAERGKPNVKIFFSEFHGSFKLVYRNKIFRESFPARVTGLKSFFQNDWEHTST